MRLSHRLLVACSALLLLCARASAAPAPEEFVNIRWNTSLADAKRTMSQRPGVWLKEESPERLVFGGGDFSGQAAWQWILDFSGGGFRGGTVHLVVTDQTRDAIFAGLDKSLADKYGKGTPDRGNYHARTYWEWKVMDPKTGERGTTAIFLNFDWWKQEEYTVRYYYVPHPNPDDAKPAAAPPAKKDL